MGDYRMKPHRPLRALLLSMACSAALAAQAQTAPRLDIPAGDLAAALDAYAHQTGTQLVYRADQLKGARSAGLQGQATPQALDALLRGSGFRAQRDPSGAVVIVPSATQSPAPAPVPAPAARGAAQQPPAAAADNPVTNLETVQVTGS